MRHVFEDLLKLADQDGTVNRTHEAIARRTNVPLDMVKMAIAALELPDPRSQSKIADGARLVRLEDGRDWGWKIVNHGYYRALRTAEEKREMDKERQRKNRGTKVLSGKKLQKLQSVTSAYAYASELKEGSTEGNHNGNGWHPTPVQCRLNRIAKRRDTTKWSQEEVKAWKSIGEIQEDDFVVVEGYYAMRLPIDKDYRRRDLLRLLRYWPGEVDRARNFKEPNPL